MTERNQCATCATAVARRAFLRQAAAGALAAGALAALTTVAGADRALALPVGLVRGRGARADKAYPLPADDGAVIDRDESLIIARFDGRAYAFSLACPHQNTAIRWEDGARRFQCPKHHSKYRPDGTFIEGRATRGLDRFAIRRDAGQLLVNLDALYRQDQDAAAWAAAFVQL